MLTDNHERAPACRPVVAIAVMSVALAASVRALAADPGPLELSPAQLAADTSPPASLTLAQAAVEPSEPIATRTEVETTEVPEEPALPISLSLTYALYSDYIFRGVNFSEYQGEGREMPNHQLAVSLAWDTGDWGTARFCTWFEWFAGQKKINPDRGGQNLQEVDYIICWSHPIKPIATDVTLGYTFYQFPNLAHVLRQDGRRGNNNDDRTHEYWISLTHNDARICRWLLPNNEEGVLNPSFLFAHDVGAIGGTWFEWGLSHGFAIPGIDDLTLTPAWKLAAQCDYWRHGMFFAGDQWSLTTTYDLTPVLHLPKWAGSISLSGELYFFNAWGNLEAPATDTEPRGQDEFWGGMSVTWAWGG